MAKSAKRHRRGGNKQLRHKTTPETTPRIGPLPYPYHWPSLPVPSVSRAMSLFSQMHFIEKLPADRIKQLQLEQIEQVLRHAYDTVPYYREKLSGIELLPAGGLDEDYFAGIPILTRSDIQSAGIALRSVSVPPEHGGVQLTQSSGSTGKPIEVATTGLTTTLNQALALRTYYWHRRNLSLKNVDIRTAYKPGKAPRYPKSSILPWSGPNVRLDINLPTNQLFDQFIAEDPATVQSHPYTLMLLAERSRETGIKPGKLIEARSFGEALSPKIRQVLRDEWNVPVIDAYSALEIGLMADQCPDSENLHVMADFVRIEILDEHGVPCKPGEFGRVVVTTLYNFASPLIRYEIGDYAEVGASCSCGRSFPVLTRILGRHRNLCVLKGGQRFFPEIRPVLQKKFEQIRQFQAIQKTLEDIELKIVTTCPFSAEDRAEAQTILQRKLNYPFNVKIIEVSDIPRAANGKFEEFKSDIPGAQIDL